MILLREPEVDGSNSELSDFPVAASLSMMDLLSCVPNRFVHVKQLLKIAATLPVTSCSAERCFSAMIRLKSRLRSTMDDDRLNGLALMDMHKDKNISVDSVINQFALCNRKMEFLL